MTKGAPVAARRRRVCGERLTKAFAAARPDLVRALVRVLGSSEDAQDAAQEAFLKCWRARERVEGVHDLQAWIFRVGLNAARDLQRNVWRQRTRPLTNPEILSGRRDPSPGEHLIAQEALDRLRLALTGLRPEERAVFLLRQNSDLTYEEIATRRRTPVGTIKTQMRTALIKLRTVLHETA
jgi:RNA polymerase sigma-70 factor (ECF subfamily)